MDTIAEKECSALGGLFQLIVNDLKVGSPVWEDFLGKAAKLHSHLKTTLFALAAFLDAFQKIADLATGAKGATKDIGTALTRLCLRHRSVEAKLKTFSSTIMDHLVIPLQERLEDWKKMAYQMDKDHAKEYKRVRQEIKKKSSDTLRLQKKVRKTSKGDANAKKTLDMAIQDVNSKYRMLEETEKHALRRALIEERGRYCFFVSCLRPVVESELATLHEVSHLQEVLDSLAKLTEDPHVLPSASEQVIVDVKSTDSLWSFQTPPSSPTSLGSRKSSVCSISSLNSSSGESCKSYSPSHHRSRSLSQQLPSGALRLLSVSSRDSGFTSQDTLFTRLPTPPALEVTNQPTDFSTQAHSVGNSANVTADTSSSTFPPPPSVTATWPNLQEAEQFEKAAASITKSQRPHTISSAYEHHGRPALTIQTFQPLQSDGGAGDSAGTLISECGKASGGFSEESDADDNEDFGDDVTPTHKPSTPPLPQRLVLMNRAQPKVPAKSLVIKHQCANSSNATATSAFCSSLDPVYANAKDTSRGLPKQIISDSIEHHQDMPSFQEDLAAAIAQKALLHQKSPTFLKSSPSSVSPISTLDECSNIGKSAPPIPPKTVASLDRKSLPPGMVSPGFHQQPLAQQPPPVPPHRTTEAAAKKSTVLAEKETSWNVFTDSGDSSAAHAQLMQALNARLSVLQQQESTDKQSSQQPDNRRFSVIEPTVQQRQGNSTDCPSNTLGSGVTHRRQLSTNTTRKPRAHSIGGTDREAFLNTLNLKFGQHVQQQPLPTPPSTQQHQKQSEQSASFQTSPKRINKEIVKSPVTHDISREVPLLRNTEVPSLRNVEVPPLRNVEVPTSRDRYSLHLSHEGTGARPRNNNMEIPQFVHSEIQSNPSTFTGASTIAVRQRHKQVDRRHSLSFGPDSGSHMQTFFSPLAVTNMRDDHSPNQPDGFDPSCGMMSDAAARVHNWLAGRGSVDISQCRTSLMGQIRQGINLKKAQTNDRSAPTFSS